MVAAGYRKDTSKDSRVGPESGGKNRARPELNQVQEVLYGKRSASINNIRSTVCSSASYKRDASSVTCNLARVKHAQIELGELDHHYWGSMPRLVQVLRSTRRLREEQDCKDQVRHSA